MDTPLHKPGYAAIGTSADYILTNDNVTLGLMVLPNENVTGAASSFLDLEWHS
jgi:hypothetical protein